MTSPNQKSSAKLPRRKVAFAALAAEFLHFRCECSRVLQVPEAMGGHAVRCPACHAVVTAPAAAVQVIPEVAPMKSKHESKIPELAPMDDEVAEVEPVDDAPEVEPVPEEADELPELKPMDDAAAAKPDGEGGAAQTPQ